ncbi:MAG TPA: carboxypeptidase-like regulatory domain-containing protein [Terriglobales bacterium]|nr:carboxypeptidase-like regulatory domain-containing protein [Terriglobales bacterium]
MTFRITLCIVLLVFLSPAIAPSQDKVPQIGQWECQITAGQANPYIPPHCDAEADIKPPFGSDPDINDVAISFTKLPGSEIQPIGQVKATVTSVTATKVQIHVTAEQVPALISHAQVGGSWIALGYTAQSATVKPKFVVLSVIYAPPGSTNSSVTYQSGSTTSTKLSVSDSFLDAHTATVDLSGGPISDELGITYSNSTTDGQSIVVQESVTDALKYPGPAANGLNHEYDQFQVWVNPELDFKVTPASAKWTLKNNGQNNRFVYVYAGCLLPSSTIDPSLCPAAIALLAGAQISSAEYPQILQTDPLVSNTDVDPSQYDAKRYVALRLSDLPYQYTPGAPSHALNLTDSLTSTLTSDEKKSYEVDSSVTAGGDALGLKIKDSTKWTWTYETSNERSSGTSSSALANFGLPTADMGTGKRFVQVYLDTIYRTFTFAFVPDMPAAVSGTVKGADGKPVGAGTEVTLREEGTKRPTYTVLGRLHRTVTNAQGQYTFYGDLKGTVTIQAGRSSSSVTLPAATKINVSLK